MLRTFEIDPWKIVTHKLDKENKRLQESMTSIGNGYMGMRGMFEEDYSADTHSGIYIGASGSQIKLLLAGGKMATPSTLAK